MGAAMVLAVVREEAPVATALLIAGAGGSAMCADLGSRRIRDEIDAMEVLGIDPVHRLIMPRIWAAAIVAILLDAIVSVAGIVGGWFFAVIVQHGTTSAYFSSFNELTQIPDLVMALAKAFVFGFVTLIQKIALGVSSAFLGAYLGWAGYVANQPQSAQTAEAIKLMITLVAAGGLIASALVMHFYRLDARTHARLVQEIAARKLGRESV